MALSTLRDKITMAMALAEESGPQGKVIGTNRLGTVPFAEIDGNIYLKPSTKSKSASKKKKKKSETLVCECVYTGDSEDECGENCLNRHMFIECDPDSCPMGDKCRNQRFQRKEYAKTEVIQTEKKGMGLVAREDLEANAFILEYVGEVYDHSEFQRRVMQYHEEKLPHFYFMTLNSEQIIDATKKGGTARFLNHSCDPNAVTQKWMVNGRLRIGLFTTREVSDGEELCFDYQFERYGSEAQKCYCGSANCRGIIGGEETKENVGGIRRTGSAATGRLLGKGGGGRLGSSKLIAGEYELLPFDDKVAMIVNESHAINTKENMDRFARLLCQTTVADELSTLLPILENTLDAMQHNRRSQSLKEKKAKKKAKKNKKNKKHAVLSDDEGSDGEAKDDNDDDNEDGKDSDDVDDNDSDDDSAALDGDDAMNTSGISPGLAEELMFEFFKTKQALTTLSIWLSNMEGELKMVDSHETNEGDVGDDGTKKEEEEEEEGEKKEEKDVNAAIDAQPSGEKRKEEGKEEETVNEGEGEEPKADADNASAANIKEEREMDPAVAAAENDPSVKNEEDEELLDDDGMLPVVADDIAFYLYMLKILNKMKFPNRNITKATNLYKVVGRIAKLVDEKGSLIAEGVKKEEDEKFISAAMEALENDAVEDENTIANLRATARNLFEKWHALTEEFRIPKKKKVAVKSDGTKGTTAALGGDKETKEGGGEGLGGGSGDNNKNHNNKGPGMFEGSMDVYGDGRAPIPKKDGNHNDNSDQRITKAHDTDDDDDDDDEIPMSRDNHDDQYNSNLLLDERERKRLEHQRRGSGSGGLGLRRELSSPGGGRSENRSENRSRNHNNAAAQNGSPMSEDNNHNKSSPGALPEPWKMAQDGDGRPYYWNPETRETTWERPKGNKSSSGNNAAAESSRERGRSRNRRSSRSRSPQRGRSRGNNNNNRDRNGNVLSNHPAYHAQQKREQDELLEDEESRKRRSFVIDPEKILRQAQGGGLGPPSKRRKGSDDGSGGDLNTRNRRNRSRSGHRRKSKEYGYAVLSEGISGSKKDGGGGQSTKSKSKSTSSKAAADSIKNAGSEEEAVKRLIHAQPKANKFKEQVSQEVIKHLGRFRKETCTQGRIESRDDFKFLARKLSYMIVLKEHKKAETKLGSSEAAAKDHPWLFEQKHRANVHRFITDYMAKFGEVYKPPANKNQ